MGLGKTWCRTRASPQTLDLPNEEQCRVVVKQSDLEADWHRFQLQHLPGM